MRKREKIFKRIMAIMLAVILCSSNMSWEVFASNSNVEPRDTYLNIPNSNLRKSIWKVIDPTAGENKDEKIPASRLGDIKKINGVFKTNLDISDITGIEYLTGIEGVDLYGLSIQYLNFPKMDNIKTISCRNGQVLTLYVGQLKNLEELDCSQNFIMTLDVTKNPKLKTLKCTNNGMYQLNLGEKPELTSLDVSYNCLMGLNLEGAPLLKEAGNKLNLKNQGWDTRIDKVSALVEERDGMYYTVLDMRKILGEQCIGRIKNPTFPSEDGSSCFDDASAKFEAPDSNFSWSDVITYNYQVFGASDDSIKMPVRIQFDYSIPKVKIKFQYLDSDGIKWKLSSEYEGLPGQSFADVAPIPPDILGYDFVGWDRSVDYVSYGGTFTAIYEEPSVPHTVTFKDYDGTTIGVPQEVAHGGNAVAPNIPDHGGLTFFKWDKLLDNITSDNVVITASYTVSRFDDAVFRKFVWNEVLGGRPDPFDNALTDAHNIYTSDLAIIESYNTTHALPISGVANINGIEYFKGLKSLSIFGNTTPVTIKSIDLRKNTNLEFIQLFGFELEELELGNNPNLEIVRVYETKLKALDVSGCRIGQKVINDVGDLALWSNDLESLTLGSQPTLMTVFIQNNPKLGNIDVTGCPELVKLDVANTGTTAINVTENPNLIMLDVSYNRMTILNVTENTQLETLKLTGGTPDNTQILGNKVKDLNLSKNPKLRNLQCEFNEIIKLNLEQNRSLVNLYCQKNEFTSLDVSLAKDLQNLNCFGNKLSKLDVHANTKLQRLNCSENSSINTLDLSSNSDLAELICSGMSLKTLDLSDMSKLQYLVCSDNLLYQLELHPDAFDTNEKPPLGVTRRILINPQNPLTINPLLNIETNKFEYDVNTLFDVSTLNMYRISAPIDNVSFGTDLEVHGTYDTISRRITFDTYNVTPFTYKYSTKNTQTVNANSAEFLQVKLTPNFGNFYKVTYYDGEKKLLEAEAPEKGTLTRPSGIPASKTGYQFSGWYKEPGLTKQWNFATDTVTEKTDLYAKWTHTEYTVTFDSVGGTEVLPAEKVYYDDLVQEPSNVVLPGKTLTGWYMEADYKNKWNFETDKLTYNMKLYAKWQDKKYAVQYDTCSVDSASIPKKINVLYDDVSLLPLDPVRTGYDFAGWKCGETSVTSATKYMELVADDTVGIITLEAQWTAHYFTVNYNTGFTDVTVEPKTNVTWDEENLLPEAPVKAGQTFNGWKNKGNAVTKEMKYRELTLDAAEGTVITLYADWTAKKYVVNYVTNSIQTPTVEVKQNVLYVEASLLPSDPVRTGYDFAGWKCGETPVTSATKYKELVANDTVGSITLEAQWTAHYFTVNYNTGFTDVTVGAKTNVTWDEENLLPEALVKAGHTFNGWKSNGNAVDQETKYKELTADAAEGTEITLDADWTAKEYVVNYVTNSIQTPTIEVKENVLYDDASLLPLDPVRRGYSFAGWKCGEIAVASTTKYKELTADDTVGSITLEAQWTAHHFYISYDSNGGSLVSNKTNVIWEDAGLLPEKIPTRPGFGFNGWYMDGKMVTSKVQYLELVEDDRDGTFITFTAEWVELSHYSVQYDLVGGNMPEGIPQSITNMKYADKISLPTPIRPGFIFEGWKFDEAIIGGEIKYSDLEAYDTIKLITLTASWTEREDYSVTYAMDGGVMSDGNPTQTDNMKYSDIVKTPIPINPGFSFGGWIYKNVTVAAGSKYSALETNDAVNSVTLTANWTKMQDYSVEYLLNGGTMPNGELTLIQGMVFADLVPTPTLVKIGFKFNGWMYSGTLLAEGSLYSGNVANDTVKKMNLSASWTEREDYSVTYAMAGGVMPDGNPTQTDNMKYSDIVNTPIPINPGFSFGRWTYKNVTVETGSKYSGLETDDAVNSLTLTANWIKMQDYSVEYLLNEGTMPTGELTLIEGMSFADLIPTPTLVRSGFTFNGWMYNGTLVTEGSLYSGNVANDTVKKMNLSASWTEREDYSVTYAMAGGVMPDGNPTQIDNMKYSDIVNTPIPINPGFSFGGWTYKNVPVESGSKYSALETNDAVNSVTLTANWTKMQDYSVEYQLNGGTMPTGELTLIEGMSFADLLPTPTLVRKGFTFNGWMYNGTLVAEGSSYSGKVANDAVKKMILSASWTERVNYRVTYAMDGGVMPDGNPTQTDNMKYSDIVKTPIPINPGFSFGGWTYKKVLVASGSKYSELEADEEVNSLTLSANWTKMQDYSVEYLLNGGTMPNGALMLIEGMAFADLVPTPTSVRTGFTFNGWMYNGTLVAEGSLYSGNAANDTVKKMSLSASWTEREDYSVKYAMDGGVMTDGNPTQTDNMKYSDIVNTPIAIKLGFSFGGWTYKDKPVEDKQKYETLVQDDSITQIELAAVWQIRTDYRVYYNLNGGQMPEGVPDKIENMKFGDVVQTPKPVRKGFTFEGWKYIQMPVSNGILYGEVAENDTVTALVLTALWKANHYTVKYETGVEGIAIKDKTDVTWEQAGLLPSNFKRPGYGIKNWSRGEKTVSAETKYSDLALDDIDGTSILLTAKWIELKDYSIIYDVGGGTMPAGTDLSVTGLKYAGKVPVPEPTKIGHTFQNWSYQNAKVKAGSKYSDLTQNDEVKTIELKAVWKAYTYKVSYAFVGDIPKGMQVPKNVKAVYGTKVSAPTLKEQAGFTFNGWYTDQGCTQKYNFNTLISGELQLYGKWLYSGKIQMPTGTSGGDTSSVPTGDTNNLALLFALSLLSGIMVVALARKRKKNNAKDIREKT